MIIETKNTKISQSFDLAKILQEILKMEEAADQDKEHFWVIGLNTNNQINYIDLTFLGTLDSVQTHPREIFRLAIIKACKSIIIAHNHPSSNLAPSEGDKMITSRLKKAGELLEIKLLDHIIINQTAHYSFADEGELW